MQHFDIIANGPKHDYLFHQIKKCEKSVRHVLISSQVRTKGLKWSKISVLLASN